MDTIPAKNASCVTPASRWQHDIKRETALSFTLRHVLISIHGAVSKPIIVTAHLLDRFQRKGIRITFYSIDKVIGIVHVINPNI
jgi:hypothetical protein